MCVYVFLVCVASKSMPSGLYVFVSRRCSCRLTTYVANYSGGSSLGRRSRILSFLVPSGCSQRLLIYYAAMACCHGRFSLWCAALVKVWDFSWGRYVGVRIVRFRIRGGASFVCGVRMFFSGDFLLRGATVVGMAVPASVVTSLLFFCLSVFCVRGVVLVFREEVGIWIPFHLLVWLSHHSCV